MDLYVRLCGASPYLVSILNSHPGMIDELLDSLMLGRLPTQSHLSLTLDELCRGAEDIDAIVQSFKNTVHLSIGVRDILGKENVSETHRTLADVADVCLQQTIHHHFNTLVKRYGIPTLDSGDLCRFGVIAMGKLGSREPNYHSDVTVLFLFEGSGSTRPVGPARHHQAIGNDFFFHQLAQRVAQGVNRVTRHGRLYELHHWQFLRERQSNLAWPVLSFLDQFLHGNVAATQRMLLSTSRIIAGDPSFEGGIRDTIHQVLREIPWTQSDTDEALSARSLLERTARPENLKRGVGGTMDVETLAQILSMQQSSTHAAFPVPGTIDSLELLRKVGAIPPEDALQLKDAYNFLRGVESGLRLMNSKARHDLPKEPLELARLAYGLHIPDPTQLQETCDHYRRTVRAIFERLLGKPFPQNDLPATSSSPPATEELHR
jgi:glutamate-ammonia-ligase adenylyltransferase